MPLITARPPPLGVEDYLRNFIETACAGGPRASKAVQTKIAQYMQDWAATEINNRLEANGITHIKANPKGHKYIGGWRGVSVDVHIGGEEFGLILALDPKHLQSTESIRKNWQNALNDLIAFAGNLHTRFPICVVGGLFGFAKSQINDDIIEGMEDILEHVAIREQPSDQHGLLEACGIVVYECNPPKLSPSIPSSNSICRPEKTFDRIIDLLLRRYIK